jgi:hypothetical protein
MRALQCHGVQVIAAADHRDRARPGRARGPGQPRSAAGEEGVPTVTQTLTVTRTPGPTTEGRSSECSNSDQRRPVARFSSESLAVSCD